MKTNGNRVFLENGFHKEATRHYKHSKCNEYNFFGQSNISGGVLNTECNPKTKSLRQCKPLQFYKHREQRMKHCIMELEKLEILSKHLHNGNIRMHRPIFLILLERQIYKQLKRINGFAIKHKSVSIVC